MDAFYSSRLNLVKRLEPELTPAPDAVSMPPMPDPKESVPEIARRLRATREALGFDNQADFCRRAGLKTNTYNQWEKAKGRPDLDGALLLRAAFRISLDWIYCGDDSCLPHQLATAVHDRLAHHGRPFPNEPPSRALG